MYIVQTATGSLRDGTQAWNDLIPVYRTLAEAGTRVRNHRVDQESRPDPIRVVVIVK
jgi:hypothetical protein